MIRRLSRQVDITKIVVSTYHFINKCGPKHLYRVTQHCYLLGLNTYEARKTILQTISPPEIALTISIFLAHRSRYSSSYRPVMRKRLRLHTQPSLLSRRSSSRWRYYGNITCSTRFQSGTPTRDRTPRLPSFDTRQHIARRQALKCAFEGSFCSCGYLDVVPSG